MLLFLLFVPLYGEDEGSSSMRLRHIDNIETREVILPNGLRVLIKPHKRENGEVNIQLIAAGGYSSLEKSLRPSGMIAGKVAMESGLGVYTPNELSYILYRDAIDLTISIEKNHRVVDIGGRTFSLESVFKIIQLIFREHRFTESAFKKVIKRELDLVNNRQRDNEQNFESLFFSLNTENEKAFRPITKNTLSKARLDKAEDFFNESFSNPAEFTLVIVGDIDISAVTSLVDQYLSSLTNHPTRRGPSFSPLPSFPKGVTKQVIASRHKNQAFTRITLPISLPLDQENADIFDLASQLVEKRLRKVVEELTGKALGIDVCYELPLYPNTQIIWMVINFHSGKELIGTVEQVAINELKRLGKEKLDEGELQELMKQHKKSENFWKRESSYWQAKLANYSIWGWDLTKIESEESFRGDKVQSGDLALFFSRAIPSNNYTLISSSH